MKVSELFGTELPIIQAPMAGAQSGAMAIAVSNAGALGSLPCALLTAGAMRKEIEAMRAQTAKPYNVIGLDPCAPDQDMCTRARILWSAFQTTRTHPTWGSYVD